MGQGKNIVHQYFKKEIDGATVLVRVDPIFYKGVEITLVKGESPVVRELDFDEQIFEDLEADEFAAGNPLEFNLYWAGLKK
ncbi:MAG: hypothetical protein K1X47_10490 [Cyclobacteriaceae bacterium]|nr:hypothetical protein [Cyclobacteriaceae bacterium]